MNVQELLDGVLLLISVATLISGAVQIFAPGFMLGLIAGKITPATQLVVADSDLLSGILIFWYMKHAGNQKSLP